MTNMSALDKVNVRRLMMLMERQVGEALANPTFKIDNAEAAGKATQAYLDMMVNRNAILAGSVAKSVVVNHTWTSLYPKLFDRVRAMIAKAIGLQSRYYEPRWFHVLFPFQTKMEVFATDEFFDSYIDKDDYKNYVFPMYYADLTYPHQTVDQDIYIQPNLPATKISISFNVTRP